MASAEGQPAEASGRKPLIVAAIPCFNEERFIGSVVLRARKHVDRVIVVDDGSTDATAEIAASAGAVVVRHNCNQGVGVATRTAIRRAREMGADVMIRMDGDGQHNADEIPAVVAPILRGEADVVVGSRFLAGKVRPPFFRRIGQRVLTTTTNVGSGTRIKDSQSGFRAFSAKALEKMTLTEDGFGVESEMQFAIARNGLKLVEVPIAVIYTDKAKRNPVAHGVSVLSRVLVLLSLRQPMVLFGIPGLLLLGGGVGLGIWVLDIFGRTNQLAIGYLLGAVLLSLVGILALFAALMLQSMKELLRGQWERFERTAENDL
ncbi:MAG: glycosyltransferase family 2 protein [Dehalococcoidia bacterium]|nr:glycosyltransferase family 2 protein [Dehalococcoidia bacterium]